MNKVSAASSIYIMTIDRLMLEIARYEKMCENCVIMPREFYEDMIDSLKGESA